MVTDLTRSDAKTEEDKGWRLEASELEHETFNTIQAASLGVYGGRSPEPQRPEERSTCRATPSGPAGASGGWMPVWPPRTIPP